MSTSHASVFALSLLLSLGCKTPYLAVEQQQQVDDLIKVPQNFPQSWLVKRVSIAQAEQENLFYPKADPQHPVPFLNRFTEWSKFKSNLCDGCELWHWESPKYGNSDFFEQCKGFAIIKSGAITAIFKNHWVIDYKDF